jgi:hypothetical protein
MGGLIRPSNFWAESVNLRDGDKPAKRVSRNQSGHEREAGYPRWAERLPSLDIQKQARYSS